MHDKARVLIDQGLRYDRVIRYIGKVHLAALVDASGADAAIPKQDDLHTQVAGNLGDRLFHALAELNAV